jgi:NADH dehydrogenase FAD-containing subunit
VRYSEGSEDVENLKETTEEIPYTYLVMATGVDSPNSHTSSNGSVGPTLPSRVGISDKAAGEARIRALQQAVSEAKTIVVAGGGAAGFEVATDAKDKYPDKRVVLVHSRKAVMHRFGPELQEMALGELERLGVEVILEERVLEVKEKPDGVTRDVVIRSGKAIECDCYVSPSIPSQTTRYEANMIKLR